MKETELQELERALQAATPPPWRAEEAAYYLATHYSVRDANDWTIVTDESGDGSDTAAIAALRNAAPSLISELRSARRALGDLCGFVESGDLVRCTARDDEPGWAIRSMNLVMTLKRAQEIVAGTADASPPPDSSAALREQDKQRK